MAEGRKLARPVYLGGEMIPAGATLTAEQAEQVKNPKAFSTEPTLADKVAEAQEAYEKALKAAEAEADAKPKDTALVKDDRAENGAALARASKAEGATAPRKA